MTTLKGVPPTPDQIAAAWRARFGPVLRRAAGKDGRLSGGTGRRLATLPGGDRLVGNNVLDFFSRTGQETVSAQRLIGLEAQALREEAAHVAGSNQVLSLRETMLLGASRRDDVLYLRGKGPADPAPTSSPAPSVPPAPAAPALWTEDLPYEPPDWHPALELRDGAVLGVDDHLEYDEVPGLTSSEQALVRTALGDLWRMVLVHRSSGGAVRLGSEHNGTLRVGPWRDPVSGEVYQVAQWRDIDDASYAAYYQPDAAEPHAWVLELIASE